MSAPSSSAVSASIGVVAVAALGDRQSGARARRARTPAVAGLLAKHVADQAAEQPDVVADIGVTLRIPGSLLPSRRATCATTTSARPMAEPKVLVMVLAGGEGKRLLPLTNDRAKPAVPFGGTLPHHRLRAVELRQRRVT